MVFATIPLTEDVPGATRLFDVVFVLVAVFTLLQAPTLQPLARALHLTEPGAPTDLTIEAAPLGGLRADVLQAQIPAGSGMAGATIRDLRITELGAVAPLVIRDARNLVPDLNFRLAPGDTLLVLAPQGSRTATAARLRDVANNGPLARWHRPGDQPAR